MTERAGRLPRRHIPRASAAYVVLLGTLAALPPLGIDMGLPALPGLQAGLAVSPARATETLSVFLLGFAIGPVLLGPLSDRYGRKPLLLFGLGVFTATAVGCALASSIQTLLAFRLAQGVGAGAAAALPAAIVRDAFAGDLGRTRQSQVTLVNAVAPLAAPLIGAAVLRVGDWRTVYGVLTAVGGLLLAASLLGYEETAPPRDTKSAGVLTALTRGYRAILADRQYVVGTLILALSFGGMFAYIASSSLVFIGLYGVSAAVYSLLFAVTAAGTVGGAALNGALVGRGLAGPMLLRAGLGLSAAAALGLSLIAGTALATLPAVAALLVVSNFSAGVVMPNATHEALLHQGHVAGSAAALQRAGQMLVGAAAGACCGWWYDGRSAAAMAYVMLGCAVLALVAFQVGTRVAAPRPA